MRRVLSAIFLICGIASHAQAQQTQIPECNKLDSIIYVDEIERIVLGHAYYIPGIWWARSVVHWAKVKNYVAPPNHYSNQKLQDVWLSED